MYTGRSYNKELDVRVLPNGGYSIELTKGNLRLVKKFRVYC